MNNTETAPHPVAPPSRRGCRCGSLARVSALGLGALLLVDVVVCHTLLWKSFRRLLTLPAAGRAALLADGCEVRLARRDSESGPWTEFARIDARVDPAGLDRAALTVGRRALALEIRPVPRLSAPPEVAFVGAETGLAQARMALASLTDSTPRPNFMRRLILTIALTPFVAGCERRDGRWCVRLKSWAGELLATPDGRVARAHARLRLGDAGWRFDFRCASDAATDLPGACRREERVPAVEMDASLAGALDLLALQLRPVVAEPDTVRRAGAGVLEIRGGTRRLLLRGDAREIGRQHGRLLAANAGRLTRRIVYGIGLCYAVTRGQWFPAAARRLATRQERFIDPEHLEEMRGLAEGAGLPFELVRAANLFPEFFHCSGAALRGGATVDGRLLHARVLDYMTHAGLQDEAVVMAVARKGRLRFVNVGYAGFIGSVTGMNEAKVAIGEMGGRGEGLWDGTPMSLLVRGALERCRSSAEALEYMRAQRRTCEYYYVVSDGKDRSCAGVKATPDLFEVVRPGDPHPQLPDPLPDTVLLSSGKRYRELVARVRAAYGRIDEETLERILDRPVSMAANLHNVIFSPETLALRVSDAGRREPACARPYRALAWETLFAEPTPGPGAVHSAPTEDPVPEKTP